MNTTTSADANRLMFDGWYTYQEDAEGVASLVKEQGAAVIGLVLDARGDYGVLYVLPAGMTPERWHFPNHAFFPGGAIYPGIMRGGWS